MDIVFKIREGLQTEFIPEIIKENEMKAGETAKQNEIKKALGLI